MNTAMQIMSIQHQLVLAITDSSDLKKVLHKFLRACSILLSSNNNHLFTLQDPAGTPVYQAKKNENPALTHYLSFPMQKQGIPWSKFPALANNAQQFYRSNARQQTIHLNSEVYHCFKVGDFAVLIIERSDPLDQLLQNALLPVIQKLAASCTSSMLQQALLLEIQTRKTVEEKQRYQAAHDHLTGLYNRIELQQRLHDTLLYIAEDDQQGCLLLIDLVHFKNINDVMGHHVGDKVLCQIASRLTQLSRENDTVARFGGDEFILLLADLPHDHDAAQQVINTMIHTIIGYIETPIEVTEGTFSLSCFIGYDTFNNSDKTVHDIIKNANIAMYEAIKVGSDKARAYHATMSELLNKRIHYTAEIKNALINNEFELHYQPQFDHLGNIIGAEALLRWNNPLRGYESPALYIPIAEESDLILQIGDFVLTQACADIRQLEQLQLPSSFQQISVNVSAKQLARTDFVDVVMNAIEQHQIPPSRLKIEITESIMMGDIELSISYLEKLRQYGVQSAIDDFGTGYSSLAYLRRLPASLLKIDRVFVTDIHEDEGNLAIASMIIGLGQRLNMQVIAEGVENQQELDCLIALGCYQYQATISAALSPLMH